MKAFFRSAPVDRVLGALISMLIVFGITLPLCRALNLPVSVSRLALYAALFSGGFALFSLHHVLNRIGWVLSFLAVGVFVYVRFPAFEQCFFAFTLSGDRLLNALAIHSGTLVPLVCFILARLLTIESFSDLSVLPGLVWMQASLVVMLLLFAPHLNALYILPLLLAFLFILGQSTVVPLCFGRILPSAALCMLCATLVLPGVLSPYPPFAQLMQKTRQFMEDHFFFTQSRTVYSLYMSGYQPYGHEHLGGPIQPTDDAVMEVETDETVLLRGVLHNDYTGSYWRNTLPANRYLLGDIRFQGLRKKTFDLSLPAEDLRTDSSLFTPKTVRIHMLKDGFSTLFVPARTQSLSTSEGMVPYFSPAGEMFITRDLAAQDSYSVTAPLFHADTPGVASLVARAQQNIDTAYADMISRYTAVPDIVEDAVYQLTAAVTQNAQTPFEKAKALCEFLRTRYPYTYAQNPPPADRDFVSWFLLEEKQGYCVSYASAMAVMGRIAGLPTRYVEGYVAQPEEDGIARVSELNAHAWVEVYFSGFGWVAFDPTGGSVLASDESHDTQDDPTQNGDPPPQPTPSPDPDEGNNPDAPNPSTSPENPGADDLPTPEPTPSPTPEPDDSPENPPPNNADAPTPTPPPAANQSTPTPPPDTPDGPPSSDQDNDDPPPYWLLFLLALIAAVAVRLYTARPAFVAAHVHHPHAHLMIYYRAILTALSCMHLTRFPDESPITHAVRAWHTLDGKNARDLTGIVRAAQIVSAAQYSLHAQPEAADIDFLATVYLRLFKRMTTRQKLHLFCLRLIKGAGNWKQI